MKMMKDAATNHCVERERETESLSAEPFATHNDKV